MAKHIMAYCRSEGGKWEKYFIWVKVEVCAKTRSEWEAMQNILEITWYSYALLPKWKHMLSVVFFGQVWAVLPKVLDIDQFLLSESSDMNRLGVC